MSEKQLPVLVMFLNGGWGCVSSTLKILFPLLNKAVVMVMGVVAQTYLEVPRVDVPSWSAALRIPVGIPWCVSGCYQPVGLRDVSSTFHSIRMNK